MQWTQWFGAGTRLALHDDDQTRDGFFGGGEVMEATQVLFGQLLSRANDADRAGHPLVGLMLLDEALLNWPGHREALALKRRIEARFFSLMEGYRVRRIASVLADARRHEKEGAPERARELAIQVLTAEEDHAEALQILERADAALARNQRCC
jgi:hypothetical protein